MADWVLGKNGKLYLAAEGAADLSAATELSNVKDVTVSMEKNDADVTTRANAGWRATAPGLKECTIEFEMVWKPSDANFEAIRDAFLNDTLVHLAALTGDKATAGSEGPRGDFSITNFSRGEPLEEAMTASVTAKLSKWTEWHEAAGA